MEAGVCEVHEDNVESVSAFVALGTQWRTTAVGLGGLVYLGVDYASALALLDAWGLQGDRRRDVFEDLRVMERAALPLRNERPKEKA